MERVRSFDAMEIDQVQIVQNEHCPDGAVFIDWFDPNWGWGQCELRMEDGNVCAYTEHMVKKDDRAFLEALFRVLLGAISVKD